MIGLVEAIRRELGELPPAERLHDLLLAEAVELRARADRLERLAEMASHRCRACRRADPLGATPCPHAEAVLRDDPAEHAHAAAVAVSGPTPAEGATADEDASQGQGETTGKERSP